jgi:hypothetical protein
MGNGRLYGTTFYRAARRRRQWKVGRIEHIDRPDKASWIPMPQALKSGTRWSSELSHAFRALPLHPTGHPEYVPRNDGLTVVIEIADGARYHVIDWIPLFPHAACVEEDRVVLRVYSLFWLAEWQCPSP